MASSCRTEPGPDPGGSTSGRPGTSANPAPVPTRSSLTPLDENGDVEDDRDRFAVLLCRAEARLANRREDDSLHARAYRSDHVRVSHRSGLVHDDLENGAARKLLTFALREIGSYPLDHRGCRNAFSEAQRNRLFPPCSVTRGRRRPGALRSFVPARCCDEENHEETECLAQTDPPCALPLRRPGAGRDDTTSDAIEA